MKGHIFHIFTAIAIPVLTACSDIDLPGSQSMTQTDDIRFSASMRDGASDTRGTSMLSLCEGALPMASRHSADSLYLHSEIVDWATPADGTTRSNMVGSQSGMYGQFNVSAYYYTDSWTSSKALYQPNFLYSVSASGDMTNGYALDSRRYWPESGKMRFIAFAPFDSANAGDYVMANVDSVSGPYVHIEANSDVASQKDLLVAYSEEVDCSGARAPQNLNFKHALSCIQFVSASDMDTVRVKSIAIKGVTYRGDLRYADNMADAASSSTAESSLNDSYHAWEGVRDFSLSLVDSENPDGKEANPGDVITDSEHSFLMFPQVVPDSARVEITLTRKKAGQWGADEVMFGYISGKRWPAGKIVRYRLSNNSWWQELQVSTLPAFPPTGGENYFSITSFATADDGSRTGVKWTVQYEDPSNPGTFIDTKPSWYSFETDNNGAVNPDSIKVTATASEVNHTVDLDYELTTVGTYGTQSNPYNLSTGATGATQVGTTANCYIVDRPGWYILPLVYGNGIVSGADNKQAYNPGTDSSNGAISNFVNNLGNPISSPYILTDCATQATSVGASSAKVIWQDSPGLVSSSSISVDKTAFGGNGGILFEVPASAIKQGNSVIGLQVPGSDGQMMWSWHIWITPFFRDGLDPLVSETIGISNHEGARFDMLFTYLGWRSKDPIQIYTERTSKVRFTATVNGRTLTKDLSVVQAPFVSYWHGSNTYYQWGRKDPFMPFLRSYDSTWYDADGNFHSANLSAEKFGNGVDALKGRIRNPSVFQITDETTDSSGAWVPTNLNIFTNLWNGTFAGVPTVNVYDPKAIEPVKVPSHNNLKTVYDPSPAGFKVPPVHTFTGFTDTGNNIGELRDNPKNWNGTLVQYDFDCAGGVTDPYVYLFYTNPEKTAYIAFPLTGYRDWRANADGTSGNTLNMGSYGYFWTAGVASPYQGYYLELRKDPPASGGKAWIMPLDYFWQTDAFPVRPVRE